MTKPTDTIHELQRDIRTAHEKLSRNAELQARNDRLYRSEIARAQKRAAEAARRAQNAKELRKAGRPGRAKREEDRAGVELDKARRIREKAERRWRERSTKTARSSAGLKWALAGILAAVAGVAVGSSVLTPDVDNGDLAAPAPNEVVIGEPPAVDGDPAPLDTAPDPAPEAEQPAEPEPAPEAEEPAESDPVPEADEKAAESAVVDETTGAIVHAVYLGSGERVGAEMRGGVPFTITSLDGGSTVTGATSNSETGTLYSLKPGNYRLAIDDSGFNTVTCTGMYTKDFQISKGQQAVATAYLFDQGGISYGADSCLRLTIQDAK